MRLTPEVGFIISRLNSKGHRADVVGGPVRDFLRGVEPDDYDITTDAAPEETKAAFSELRTVDTGIKHGTVTLILNGAPYEITTYRIDGEYRDSRHPESVTFTKAISEDLSRRDFTMNAIAYNPADGITDPFGGREDIERKIIRAVGDPYLRFTEDALRILRALRFSATLGFTIEENTARAIREKRSLLENISAERIYTEWKKLLSGEFAIDVISSFSDVIAVFLPELENIRLPKAFAPSDDYVTRMAEIFYLTLGEASPSAFEKAAYRLKTDTATRRLGTVMLENVGKYRLETPKDAGKMLMALGDEAAFMTARLDIALGNTAESGSSLLEEYIENKMPYKISHLAVDGKDITALGFSGKAVGDILSSLITLVVNGVIKNDKDSLIAYVNSQNL